ncbi:AGE family epimerase/isomerase [Litorimonas sp.]|uniref:AGE family epimerase/isomerase n=1 Tax=Litorimonas sp. TaxID=1892381 RepID=UPI003A8772EE
MNFSLKNSADRLKSWCIDAALPYWADRARFPDGSWVEHLHLDGSPDRDAERRWRILARQVYVYSTATRLGWYDGEDIARSTYQAMRDKGLSLMMDDGYVHRILPDGTISNDMRDFYDHAFYLLASASLYHLTEEENYLFDAYDIRTFVDRRLSAETGGWFESLPLNSKHLRRQNPHMHWFEANMALYRASRDETDLAPARAVYKLFKDRFFDRKTHRIREYFQTDWDIAPAPKGDTAEPGHSAEWVWLLGEYTKLSGVETFDDAAKLYDTLHYQRSPFLNDEENHSGEVRRETKRLWVQTEAIKAHLSMAELGVPGAAESASALISGLFETYLKPDGSWADQLNACGANIAKTIPVSTFYHILGMTAEAKRVSQL